MESLKVTLSQSEFYLPLTFDFAAVFFFALTGALVAIRRGYDFIGLFTMAFVAGLGGALIRDGLFLQNGPPALTRHWSYLVAVLSGCVVGWGVGSILEKFQKVIAMIDALGLGAYSVVGVQKSLAAGLSIPAAVFVGVANACGGGLLRDIIIREEPLMLKPGQFYVMASFLGSCLFVALVRRTELTAYVCALIAIGVTFLFRMLAIAFNWRTTAVQHWMGSPENLSGKEDSAQSRPPEKTDGS
jgi:uncharacterized membrane protein YeiH